MSDSGNLAGSGYGADAPPPPVEPTEPSDRKHLKRIAIVWLIEMIIAEPAIWFLVWPYIPPGRMTNSAQGDQWDALVAIMVANGAMAGVLLYGIYALIVWRHKKGDPIVDGPPIRGHWKVQALWVAITACIVSGVFIFGTYELIVPNGAGGGEGPSPIWGPNPKTTKILNIQVIGQQWVWTYRYPQFGGFETTQLVIPNHTYLAFHVTSLDVVHDWWAYQLGVKADANPGEDNVAFTKTKQLGSVTVRCDELCGIWHGAMYDYGHIVTRAAFYKWGTAMEKKLAPLTKTLPKFAWTYYPSANGAHPSPAFYNPADDPSYKMYEYLYGKSGPEGILPGVHVKGAPPTHSSPSKGS